MAQHDVLIAVPSEGPGGLDAAISQHFGRARRFTLVRPLPDGTAHMMVLDGDARNGRGRTVAAALAAAGVTYVVVVGIGPGALVALDEAGIRVYKVLERGSVSDAVGAFLEGTAQLARPADLLGPSDGPGADMAH